MINQISLLSKITLCEIFLFAFFIYSCDAMNDNTTRISKSNNKHQQEDEYKIFNSVLTREYNLTEEKIKELQFYTSNEIELNLYREKKGTTLNSNSDTNYINVKTIKIEKFTPCLVLGKNRATKEELEFSRKEELRRQKKREENPLTKEQINLLLETGNLPEEYTLSGLLIKEGYIVDFGDNIYLLYDIGSGIFIDVRKYKNTNLEYNRIEFKKNASLLMIIDKPVDIVKSDTIKSRGRRK